MKNYLVSLVEWMKKNKLATVLALALLYIFMNSGSVYIPSPFSSSKSRTLMYDTVGSRAQFVAPSAGISGGLGDSINFSMNESYPTVAPDITTPDRRVITSSNLDILVEDVTETVDNIQKQTESISGFMVNKYISTPYEGGRGEIVVRIPVDARDSFVEYVRGIGVRTLNENIQASDVTDQYTDYDARLRTLESILFRYESLLNQTEDVDAMMKIHQRIIQTQSEIDSVKGQMKSIDTKSITTLISINLTTDELALPYTPEDPWRPEVVFKLAVRSLVETLRFLADNVIWLAVYAVIWVPALVGYKLARKYLNRRKQG